MSRPAMAAIKDSLRYQSGVRNSVEHGLNPKQIERLLKSLREKTGFPEMRFDEMGFLRLGDRSMLAGGSATARELLIAAVDRACAIDLESHDRSSRIAFAQLGKPLVFISLATSARIEVNPIEIDFSDFAHLRGDKAVLAAFDVGFVVLHELAHAVLGLHDLTDEANGPGECEEYVNRIRRELDLPERQNYIARTRQSRDLASGAPLSQAELIFAHTVDQEGRTKRQSFNLTWDAEPVGMIRTADFKPSSVVSTNHGNRKTAPGASVASAP
ncbi:MAG: hypothetical protein ABIP14_17985 [Blastocatellia bacterium]